MSKSVAGTQPKSRSTSLWRLSSQHNSATHGLDLLLGQGRDELGLDDNGLLGQLALAQHLGGAEGRGAAKRGVGFKCQLQLAGVRRGRNDTSSSAHRQILASVLGCAVPTIHLLMRHTAKHLMHTNSTCQGCAYDG